MNTPFNQKVAAALADRSLQTTPFQRVSFFADIDLNIVELKLHPFNGVYSERPTAHVRYHINRDGKIIRTTIPRL